MGEDRPCPPSRFFSSGWDGGFLSPRGLFSTVGGVLRRSLRFLELVPASGFAAGERGWSCGVINIVGGVCKFVVGGVGASSDGASEG